MRHGGAAKQLLPSWEPGDEDALKPAQSFGQAFSEARKAGKRAGDTFVWNGSFYDAGIPGETPAGNPRVPDAVPKELAPDASDASPEATSPDVKINSAPKVMSAVAGCLGWQLAKPKKQNGEPKIDPQAFGCLEKKMYRRRFREWMGTGFQR